MKKNINVLSHLPTNIYVIEFVNGQVTDLQVSNQVEGVSGVPIVNLVGKTDLVLSAAVISQLSLLITNDSAPLHLASATGTPVVAVFCATVPEFGFGPWQVIHETIGVSGLACRPCGRHGGQHCPTGTHACQVGLSSRAVIEAAQRVLERASEEAKPEEPSLSLSVTVQGPCKRSELFHNQGP